MTLQEFFNKYNNQPNVGNTAENRGECVGLVMKWIQTLSLPTFYGHAKDLYSNAPNEYFAKILNTPEAIVQEGDIVVWGARYNGTYGHTGIAKGKADVNNFDCFEQNDPLGSKPHIKKYNYAYIIGWLRPKKADIPPPIEQPVIISDQTKYDFGEGFGIQELGAIKSILHDLKRDYNGVLAQTNDLKRQLNECLNKPQPPHHNEDPSFADLFFMIFLKIKEKLKIG